MICVTGYQSHGRVRRSGSADVVGQALSDLDFSSDDSSSSEEDERPKRKTGDFTGLCHMGKSSRHISDSDSNVSDDSSLESLSL
jgi:hypothetical protein